MPMIRCHISITVDALLTPVMRPHCYSIYLKSISLTILATILAQLTYCLNLNILNRAMLNSLQENTHTGVRGRSSTDYFICFLFVCFHTTFIILTNNPR